ncbi:MAG: cytochrome c biogenesis protein CcsA, partial [Deltaproteobacteria bacterium]|nr:cytochrome c biogenesis protein CcsA [Deltaproteobacteria bacterium]
MTRILFYLCALLAAAGFAVAPYLLFLVAPTEPTMGFVQKIFYFHVPCAWVMFLSAILCGVAGGVYLFRGRLWADAVTAATAEITVVFGALVLITGPLWAKIAWGHYWVWDVRLTTVLLLFLIFVAVLLARRYAGPTAKRIAAGLALFGAADVPLIYTSVKIWKTMHPETSVVPTLDPAMRPALFVSLGTFTALFVLLFWIRLRLERSRYALDELVVALTERERHAAPAASRVGAASAAA